MENPFSFGVLAAPAVLILLSLVGALLALRWRRMGLLVVLPASLLLYAAATPALSSWLLRRAEAAPVPEVADLAAAQAIVVLGGDARQGDGAAIADRLGPLSIERAAMAAAAYRRLHLPLLVSGGRVGGLQASEAALLQAALADQFDAPVRWVEDRSRNTWENAVFSAAILRPEGVATVVLVSQAWHLPRAQWAFERAGLRAVAWPAPRTALRLAAIDDLLPNTGALHDSFHALHELIGSAYYHLRY